MGDGSGTIAPGAKTNGAALARSLEFSAREKGIPIILNMHMDEILREQPYAGRVIGIKASYSPRFDPITGVRLESLWSNGNIDERGEVIYVKANKAVVVASGGHTNNPSFRSQFIHGMRDPAFVGSGWAMMGHRALDGSGIIASMKIGARLAGLHQNLSYANTFHFPGTLATRDAYTDMLPGHPTFPFRGSTGIALGGSAFEHLIVVNQVGKRYFNDILVTEREGGASFPAGPGKGQPASGLDFKQLDWHNASAANIRATYQENNGIFASLAINEGSSAPDWFTGPKWAIFDRAAVERDGWNIEPPYTSDTNGYFFQADTIEELAEKVYAGHEFQRVPLTYLKETVDKWNAAAANGGDLEYGRGEDAPMWPISTPPFYAASLNVVWHDSYGGLNINSKAQVIDMQGHVIPGLYSGGENSGGGNQHGLGRALVHGFIAGTNAAAEPSA
jgi:hypothetical protein